MKAFRWMNVGFEERDEGLFTNLNNDFALSGLRGDPRFAELMKKTGIPEQKGAKWQTRN